ncbi:carboxymuconolactone decarboxylase family protein [Streptomyces lydicamycinicus]|uniref:carboxymuconolactone decarboxylase family protein n=1 Tax=Streptomyces lydicamycinicus TaxID=1546107 RepID=UPI0020362B41|nr:carboxymuconolactone decarboxylase family protein [Streptomyces lydicamycinicus]USA01664.1 carboxymuconolactone decarboxylase family protein [Streptomyces lydicamycinicus]
MARISLIPRRTLTLRLAEWYSRRAYGEVLQPALAMGHHPRVLRSYFSFESKVARWKALDPALKLLAEMASAVTIGCSWCVDFGHWHADRLGLPLEKVSKVPDWRAHEESFTELERLVMEYAEAMTATPPAVTDELAESLRRRLGDPAFVELTTMVAVENLRSRTNSALGLHSQGFSDACAIPPGSGVPGGAG